MMTKDRMGGTPTTAPSATAIAYSATVTPPLQSQSIITISTHHASTAVSGTSQASTLATVASDVPNSSNFSSSIGNRAAIGGGVEFNGGTIYQQQSAKPPPATLSLSTSATTPLSIVVPSGPSPVVRNPIKSPATGGESIGKRC